MYSPEGWGAQRAGGRCAQGRAHMVSARSWRAACAHPQLDIERREKSGCEGAGSSANRRRVPCDMQHIRRLRKPRPRCQRRSCGASLEGWAHSRCTPVRGCSRFAPYLKDPFPDMRGWSSSKLQYMRFFGNIAPTAELVSSLLTNCHGSTSSRSSISSRQDALAGSGRWAVPISTAQTPSPLPTFAGG